MNPKLSLGDRWKRWSYLQDVDLWMSALPGSRRREIRKELGANLADASAERGMAAAIEDMGPARRLAREYLDAEPYARPIWYQGAIAALAVAILFFAGIAIYTFGMIDALTGAETESAEGSFLGVRVVTEVTPDFLGASFHGFSWPTLIAGVLAWLIGSRIWRLTNPHRSRAT